MIRYLLALSLPFAAMSAYGQDTTKVPQELTTPNYRVSEISGIGAEPDIEFIVPELEIGAFSVARCQAVS